MMGDDEGSSRSARDAAIPQPEPSTTTELPGNATAEAAESSFPRERTFVADAHVPTGPDSPASDGRSAFEHASPPAFNVVTALLAVAVVGLLASTVYLYSLLPNEDRLAGDERTLADLRSQIASVEAHTAAPDLTPITRRIEALEKQLPAVRSDLSALQQQPAAPAAAASDAAAQIGALSTNVSDLQHGLDPLRPSIGDLTKRLAASDARVDALESKVTAISTVDLGPLNGRLDAFDAQLKPLVAEAQAAKSPARVTEVRQNGSGAEARAAPLAVTADAVLRAINAGRPFGDELKALRNLGADSAALEPLAAVAEAGAPTTENLRADLNGLRERIVAQGVPAPSGSYLDRLMAGAATVVSVRPTGSVPGDTPAALGARMDDKLRRDDLAAALADWQKLPDESRTVSKGLADRIRLRQDAQVAAGAIARGAIQAMAARP